MEYRYMPPISALLDQVRQATATGGTVMLSIREHRYPFLAKVGDWNRFARNTGGTLVEKCCHFFDLMRLVIGRDPVRVFASGGQNHNHLDESYVEGLPDILDNAFVVVDFGQGQRAMLDLCMFAEGSRYQEHISVVGPVGKVECFIPGPTRFWPEATLGPAPVAQLVVSPRSPQGPRTLDIPVDAALLAAGDHNGSTFYQHQRFFDVVASGGPVEVSLQDGLKAVLIGLAAGTALSLFAQIGLLAGAPRIDEVFVAEGAEHAVQPDARRRGEEGRHLMQGSDAARRTPGGIAYGAYGAGTQPNLLFETLAERTLALAQLARRKISLTSFIVSNEDPDPFIHMIDKDKVWLACLNTGGQQTYP